MRLLLKVGLLLLVVVADLVPFVSCHPVSIDKNDVGSSHRDKRQVRQKLSNSNRKQDRPIFSVGEQLDPERLLTEQQEEFTSQSSIVQPIETSAVRDIISASSKAAVSYYDNTAEDFTNIHTRTNRIRLKRSIKFVRRGSFPGANYSGVTPPNTIGDVGITQYVQMTNVKGGSKVIILNKRTGKVQASFILNTLAPSTSTTLCSSPGGYFPIVFYDQYDNRWILTEMFDPSTLCFYISQTSDALGKYKLYEFTSSSEYIDYLKFGVWRDAYYVGSNEDTAALYALERNAILAGKPAKMIRNYGSVDPLSGFYLQFLPPVDADGPLLPADDLPDGLFVRHVDDELHYSSSKADPKNDFIEIYTMKVNFTTMKSQVTLSQTVKIPEFSSAFCINTTLSRESYRECVPQPNGTSQRLDAFREIVMNRPQYRNYYHYDTIVLSWAVGVKNNTRIGVFWIELRRLAGTKLWTVHQQQQYSPNSVYRWMSSIAMNGCGDMAVGYSVSDAVSVYPGIRAVGRLVSDKLGTVTSKEQTLIAGEAVQGNRSRWGQYASMTVDPIDDKTFWFTSEYISKDGLWDTRIFPFRLDNSTDTFCTLTCLGGLYMNKQSSKSIVSSCREQCVQRNQIPKRLKQGWKVGRCL